MKANEKINENLTIVEYLAEGGFGKIYKGIYKKKGVERKVAVKLLEYSDEEKRNLVQQQKKNFERVKNKNNQTWVVPFLDSFEKDNTFYLVFELYDGDLRDFIGPKKNLRKPDSRNRYYLDQRLLLSIFSQLCEAVRLLHEHKIEHRDIKPQNFLYKRFGNEPHQIIVSIADLGLSKEIKKEKKQSTSIKQIVGTFGYLAPEILLKQKVEQYKGDAWSLGMTLFQIVFNKRFIYLRDREQDEEVQNKNQEEERLKQEYQMNIQEAFQQECQLLDRLSEQSPYQGKFKKGICFILNMLLQKKAGERLTPKDLSTMKQRSYKGLYNDVCASVPLNIQKQKRKQRTVNNKSQVFVFKDDKMSPQEFKKLILAFY